MTIGSYLFQSPYSQPFQVGRPDPVSLKERSEEMQTQQQQIQSNTQQASNEQKSFERSQMAVKSAVGYANSEGFAMSADQVQRLSETSLKTNRNDYLKAYSQ